MFKNLLFYDFVKLITSVEQDWKSLNKKYIIKFGIATIVSKALCV